MFVKFVKFVKVMKKILSAIWQFCSYLFWPQRGRKKTEVQ